MAFRSVTNDKYQYITQAPSGQKTTIHEIVRAQGEFFSFSFGFLRRLYTDLV